MIKFHKKKYQSGSAIVLTVIAIAAMTTLTFGIAELVPDDFRSTQAYQNSLTAENSAWAGIEQALYLLRTNKEAGTYYETSNELVSHGNNKGYRPFGTYLEAQGSPSNCFEPGKRDACPALDRQLGTPINQTPVINKPWGDTTDAAFGLVVWHRKSTVGNFEDMRDVYPSGTTNDIVRLIPETLANPYLKRDESRQLDVEGATQVRLRWKPVVNSAASQYKSVFPLNCSTTGNNHFYLDYALLDAAGNVLARPSTVETDNASAPFNEQIINVAWEPNAKTLSIRFLATSQRDLNGNSDEADISDCYMRYSLQNVSTDVINNPTGAAIETADIGMDVIDSTGISGGIQRKIRVLANRQNGSPLSIFDFSLACESCENLP